MNHEGTSTGTAVGTPIAPATAIRAATATATAVAVDTGRRTLGRTAAWLAKQVEIGLGTVDLSLPQYRILGMLDESSAVSSDLAQRLAVRPPTITAVVDGLVAKGLVERRTVAGDRRRVDHVLTVLGHQVLDAADAAVDARLHEITDVLGDPEVTEDAFRGLAGWRTALVAYRTARWGR